jgi:pimeloyl-ACP methyl ester carboxylesterase
MVRMRTVVLIVLALLFALYGFYCYRLYRRQRDVLFPGQFMSAPALLQRDGARVTSLSTSFGNVPLWYLPASSPTAPTVLFFHGNAEFIGNASDVVDGAAAHGWGVLLVEYPGYGGASGKPTEQSLDEVATAATGWLSGRAVHPNRTIAMGRSIGTGVAARVATRHALAGLILQSPYTSTMRMARRFNAPGFLVRDRYDNEAALRAYGGAVLISHGTGDQLISFDQAESLAAISPRHELIAMNCGHNGCPVNTPDYWQRVAQWAQRHRIDAARDSNQVHSASSATARQ